MKSVLLGCIILLAASPGVFAQSTSAPTSPSSQQGTTTTNVLFTDASGARWQQTRTETWTLTYTLVSGTTPAITPGPPPPAPQPAAGVSEITGYQNPAGQPVAQMAAGDLLVITGTGFGLPSPGGNRVQINGAIATIKNWSDTAVTIVVPATNGVGDPAFVQLYAQPKANWVLIATGAGPVLPKLPTGIN